MKNKLKTLICGALLGVFSMPIAACSEPETDLSHLNRALLTPEIVQLETTAQKGVWLEHYLFEASGFEGMIASLYLDSLETSLKKKGTYRDGIYEYIVQGRQYKVGETALEVNNNGEFRFSYSYSVNQKRMEYKDSLYHYIYEETDGGNCVSLTTNETTYQLAVNNDGYSLDCAYDIPLFKVIQEIYDSEGNFIKMNATHISDDSALFIAYALPPNYTLDSTTDIVDEKGNKYEVHAWENPEDDTSALIYATHEYFHTGQYFVFMREGYQFPTDLQPAVR